MIQDIKRESEEATKKWEECLERRQTAAAAPSGSVLKKYKKRVVRDRVSARRGGMKLPAKGEAPEDVDNSTGLPPAKRSRRAADMEHFFKYNSWCQCEVCHSVQARHMTPKTLAPGLSATVPQHLCKLRCGKSTVYIPKLEDIPKKLRNLSAEALLALSPLEIDVGNEVRAKEGGYRHKQGMIRFYWHATSAEDRIEQLVDKEERRSARKAHQFLIDKNRSSVYQDFHQMHLEFLEKYPNPDLPARKRGVRYFSCAAL